MRIDQVQFATHLDTRELGEDVHMLLAGLYVNVLSGTETYEILIPEGFVTDFCSVPRVPFAYTLFGGKYNRTGTLHDGLYSPFTHITMVHAATREPVKITREIADAILYCSLLGEGAWKTTASAMYTGVRAFGSKYYKRGS